MKSKSKLTLWLIKHSAKMSVNNLKLQQQLALEKRRLKDRDSEIHGLIALIEKADDVIFGMANAAEQVAQHAEMHCVERKKLTNFLDDLFAEDPSKIEDPTIEAILGILQESGIQGHDMTVPNKTD